MLFTANSTPINVRIEKLENLVKLRVYTQRLLVLPDQPTLLARVWKGGGPLEPGTGGAITTGRCSVRMSRARVRINKVRVKFRDSLQQ